MLRKAIDGVVKEEYKKDMMWLDIGMKIISTTVIIGLAVASIYLIWRK